MDDEINPVLADVLNRIAEQQADRNRIMAGWYLTSSQVASISDEIGLHDPHPDVGDLGRLNSVPVFPIEDFCDLDEGIQTDQCHDVHFTFIQMDIVN